MSGSISWCAVGALAVTMTSHYALAEAVNYGALQETFGEPVTTSAVGKPQRASAEELRRNPRARSAILRVAERTEHPMNSIAS